MKKKILLLCIACLSLLLPFTAASASPDHSLPEVDEVLLRDAAVYAEYENVTLDEALYRLHIMDIIGNLHADLMNDESGTFGGGWIEHQPQLKFVVQFTDNGRKILDTYNNKYPELTSLIELRKTDISYHELRRIQLSLMDALTKAGIQAESEPDIHTGKVNLYVTNGDSLTKAAIEEKIQLSDRINVVIVSGLTTLCTDIIGGHQISYSDSSATTGFGASDGVTEVITTAGHFAYETQIRDALYDGTIDLDYYYTPYQGSGADIAWYDPEAGNDVTNRIKDSSSTTRGILWIESYNSITPGDYIYKYGNSTGSSVGQVASVGYTQNSYSYYVRVDSIGGGALADYGDSGAPCYRGYIAIGSLVGYPNTANPDPNDMLFYPVAKLSSEYGVNVLTSP